MLKSKGSTYWQSKYYQVTDWDKMAMQFSWTCILSNMYYVVPISTEMLFKHTFNHSLSNTKLDALAPGRSFLLQFTFFHAKKLSFKKNCYTDNVFQIEFQYCFSIEFKMKDLVDYTILWVYCIVMQILDHITSFCDADEKICEYRW